MNSRIHRIVGLGLTLGSVAAAAACGAGAPVGPDALAPESFELALMNGQSLPVFAYIVDPKSPDVSSIWVQSARLKSTVAGRTIDPRIFDNRSGQGASGGSSRDSTTASAAMSDIREFQERNSSNAIVGHHTDTSSVTVERRNDLLIITRTSEIPAKIVVDTARFVDGKLVVTAREWERFGRAAVPNAQFIYSITNSN